MPLKTFAILDSFPLKDHGTVLCVRPDETGAVPPVGAPIEVLRPDGSVFRSIVKAVETFMISPPPPRDTHAPVGIMLMDDPGPSHIGSKLAMIQETQPHLFIVYCETRILLDKGPYSDWHAIQNAYLDYKTSLGPWSESELIKFFQDDYGSDDSKWPFSRLLVAAFCGSADRVLSQKST